MPALRRRSLVAALLLLAGCQDFAFDPEERVTKLRVLAVQAEPAEAPPGGQTRLTALAVNPSGEPVALSWDVCLLGPAPGEIVNKKCITNMYASYLAPAGLGESIDLTLPMVKLTDLGQPDFTGGFYLPVRILAFSGTERMTAVYRLRVSPGIAALLPNRNPTLDGVSVVVSGEGASAVLRPLDDANPLELAKGEKVVLRPQLTKGAAEKYLTFRIDPDDPKNPKIEAVDEVVRIIWYTTGGTLSLAATGEERPDSTLTLDEFVPAPGGAIDLYWIAREERGGTSWLHRRITIK